MLRGLATAIRLTLRSGPLTTAELLRRMEQLQWTDVTESDLAEAVAEDPEIHTEDGLWRLAHSYEGGSGSHRRGSAADDEIGRLRRLLGLVPEPEEPESEAPTPWREFVTEALTALREELRVQSEVLPDGDIALADGSLVAVTPLRKVLRYEAQGPLFVPDGAPVVLVMAGHEHDAELVSRHGRTVTLAVSPLVAEQPKAALRVDLRFLLRMQIERLEGLQQQVRAFDTAAALRVTEPQDDTGNPDDLSPSASDPPGVHRAADDTACLNDEQQRAVTRARNGGLSWIWGPPGTGKTTTVAHAVQELLSDGRRILLVSNTNAAVDTALSKILDTWPSSLTRQLGDVVRIGQPADLRLVDHAEGPVLVDEVAAIRGAPVAASLDRVRREIHRLRSELVEVRQMLSELDEEDVDLEYRRAQQQAARRAAEKAEHEWEQAVARLSQARQRLAHGHTMVLSQREMADRRRAVDEAKRTVAQCESDLAHARTRAEEQDTLLEKARARHAAQDVPGRRAGLERNRRRFEVELADQQALERALNELMRQVRRAVIRDARVVTATAHRAYMSDLVDIRFDVVVVDEASMLPVPLTALAVGLGYGDTVITGDFRQLPPIAQSDSEESRDLLHRSVFERSSIDTSVSSGSTPPGLTALRRQHRMHESIADLVSRAFYPENPLVTSEDVLRRRLDPRIIDALPGEALLLVDSSALSPHTARQGGTRSRYNLTHALLMSALFDAGLSDVEGGLIAPYSPQTRLLTAVIPPQSRGRTHAATVHRFQGGERDVIVYDTVETQTLPPSLWFRDGNTGSEGARLLNVAVSRARHRLVVVADVNALRKHMTTSTPVARFFREVFARAEALPWEDLVSRPGSQVDVWEDSAYLDRLIEDIDAAAHTVNVWSRLVEPGTLTRLSESLCAAAERGARVTMWIGAAQPDGVWDEVLQLLGPGEQRVKVRPVDPLRESHAVVDRVVWSSGGDLLTPSGDVVLRREHPELADVTGRLSHRRRLRDVAGTDDDAPVCPTCRTPMTRVEATASMMNRPQAWQWCTRCDPLHRRGSGSSPRHGHGPDESRPGDSRAGEPDERATLREQLRRVAVHDYLVDDM